MSKLKLDVDDVRVDSFDTGAAMPVRGTVNARQEYVAGTDDCLDTATRPSQDIACTRGQHITEPCGPCGDPYTGSGYTCDRETCMKHAPTGCTIMQQ